MDDRRFARPLFFLRDRVWRVYTGGAGFGAFLGDGSADGHTPEEWIASAVRALGPAGRSEREGVSRLADGGGYFDDLSRDHRQALLGSRRELGVLVKLLDSAVRLPVQAHPDRAFSRRHLHSDHGKAESWLVLATRPGARIYLGFKNATTKAQLADAARRSETDENAMVSLLNEIPVRPGDVFFIPAGMIHAIGAGCLMLEVQEPTDFTVQPERRCADYTLSDREMYLGLDADTALDVFDFSVHGEAAVARARRTPQVIGRTDGCLRESLISYADTPCFAIKRVTLTACAHTLRSAPAVCVVTDGAGEITFGPERRPLRRGDCFFLPCAAAGRVVLHTEGTLTCAVCLPPKEA